MTAKPPDGVYALDVSVTEDRLHRHRVAFPWSLGRAYACETWMGAFRLIPQVSGAGLLSGDHVWQRVRLEANARLRLESAGAMQVLAGKSGPARSEWSFVLNRGAMLVLDAEPYALMPGAKLMLRNHIQLAPGAIVLAAEALCDTVPNTQTSLDQLPDWQTETRVAETSGALRFIDRQVASPRSHACLRQLPDRSAAFGTIWVLADASLAELVVAELPDLHCLMALSPLRTGTGMAIRLAACNGGVLRCACRLLMSVLESRLAEAQAASQAAWSLRAPTIAAQT
ncbi:MAG: urease accessory protein UreD [Pseudomonadota bacterium]